MTTFLTLSLFASTPATAGVPTCPTPEQREQLDGFARKLADADSVDEAKTMALGRLDRSARAISRAEHIVPGDEGLAEAKARLDEARTNVLSATTTAGVFSAIPSRSAPTSATPRTCPAP